MANNKNTVVDTTYGKVKGIIENGLCVFKGIPYAAPPIGYRRWLPPEPCKPWDGILEAQDFKPIAPQNRMVQGSSQIPGFGAEEPQSEDCLYLNIWTPGLDEKARPVMVWIHGGGFTIGSGSQPSYRGDIISSRGNVVVVTINYRLGLLGFLNLNEITGGKIPSTGNEGLLDQIASLKWVRDNISAFGGDPNNITVFGESAGGMSIGCLLAMPEAQGHFHKAILESGTGHMARPLAPCVNVSKQLFELTGLKLGDAEGLRALSVEKLLAAQQELTLKTMGGITPVAPVIDGRVIPDKPLEVIKTGAGMKIPVIVGNNLEESKLFNLRRPELQNMDEAELVRICKTIVPEKYVSQLVDTYRNARNRRGELTTPPEILSAIRTDIMFRLPAVNLVKAYCDYGQAAYNYLFTWKSPALGGALGACHALEIGFVFGTFDDRFCGTGPEAEKLSQNIQDAWLAFARNGDPSCESLGEWPQYCDNRKAMMLGRECYVKEAPYEEERHIWDIIGEVQPIA